MASDTIKGDDEDDEGTLDFTLLELDAMADEILTDSPGRQSKQLGGWKSEGRRELRLERTNSMYEVSSLLLGSS
jgi:hypothetical protein